MPWRARILFSLSVALVGGSLAWSASSGLHIRGESYRREVMSDLSNFFSLPCEVARIRPRTFTSRLFEGVSVRLPRGGPIVFQCGQAIWREDSATDTNELDLLDGRIQLIADSAVRAEYREALRTGLSHDYEDLRLSRVGLNRFEIAFQRGDLSILCRDAAGTLDLSDPANRVARLTAYELNHRRIGQGAQIHARFLPGKALEVAEVLLTLPEVPISIIGLNQALAPDAAGSFSGSVQYVAHRIPPELWISGQVDGANLRDLTRGLPLGPFEGRLSVTLHAARVADSRLTHIRGVGQLAGLSMNPFAVLLGAETLSGSVSLGIDGMDIADGRVNRLRVSGVFSDLSIEEWLRPLGRGSARGRLAIRINNLDIADERIKSADVEVGLLPPTDQPGFIDRELLLSVAERAFRFTWPAALPRELLPERIEYAECGLRLLIRDNQLRILGTHGPSNETILTIRVFGRSFGVLKEPSGVKDLSPQVAEFWPRLRSYQPDRLADLLRRSTTTAPGGTVSP